MKFIMSRLLFLTPALLNLFGFSSLAIGEILSVPGDKSHYYMYTLQLVPPLLNLDNWTDKENRIVEEHFQRLKKFRDEEIVIFAGRVSEMDPDGFGIVIFKAESKENAFAIMKNDPAVREGLMTAKLYPFSISLMQIPAEFQASKSK